MFLKAAAGGGLDAMADGAGDARLAGDGRLGKGGFAQPKCSVRVNSEPVFTDMPTAMHELGDVQEAPRRMLLSVPLFGLWSIDHVVPFHDSTSVCSGWLPVR